LLKADIEIVPLLENAWEQSDNDLFQIRVENVIHALQYRYVKNELIKWVALGASDLLYGAYLVARYHYPSLDFKWIESQVNEIRKDIWFELSENLTSLEKVRVFNHIFFEVYKFTRNNVNTTSPDNNYISEVLLTKKGNPVSLAVIYSVVAQKLGLPIYGVNLPKNFILAYLGPEERGTATQPEGEVLFYINPINKGAVLGRKEIEFFLKQQKIQPQSNYFLPVKSNEEIIKRIFNNLLFSYEAANDIQKVREITELIGLFNNFY
jgi:regulator of sirC expression with transglutaminase-like and TPR domain